MRWPLRAAYLSLVAATAIQSAVAQATIQSNALPDKLAEISFREWHLAEPLAFLIQDIRASSIFSNNLIVISHSNFIGCINVEKGCFTWKSAIDGKYPQVPFAGDKIALIQALDWQKGNAVEIKALDIENGNVLWYEQITNSISSPVFFNSRMYVAAHGDTLLCLDQKSRVKNWENKFPGLLLTQDGSLGKDLIVGLGSNSLARINGDTGELIWKSEFKNKPRSIWVNGDRVFMQINYDGTQIYCVCGQNGSLLWKTESPLVTVPPLVSGKKVVLLGQSSPMSHFYGLIVVDLETGEHIWHDGGDWNVGTSVLARNILYYRRGGSLSVFDIQRGCKVGYWIIEDIFDLFHGSQDSVLLVSQKHGVVKFKPNIREITTYKDIDFFKNDWGYFGALFKIAVFFSTFAAIAIIGSGGKRIIPGTPETTGLIGTLWVVLSGFVLVQFYAGWVIWLLGNKQGLTVAHVMGLVSMTLSPFLFLFGYILHKKLYARFFFKARAVLVPAAVRDLIADLVNDMGIKKLVVAIEGGRRESPAVAGGHKRHYLIIPSDFEETVSKAACGNKEHAQALARFVLAHELAHVKKGDTELLPLLWTSQWLWTIAFLGIFAWIWATVFGNKDLAFLERPVVVLGVFVSGVCFLISWLISRANEKYTDGVASMFISPEMLQVLASPTHGSHGISILQIYLFLLRPSKYYTFRFVGLPETVKQFTTTTSARAKEIMDKYAVLNAGALLNPVLAVVAGLSGILIIQLFDVQKVLMFYHFLVLQYSGIFDYFLKGMSFWNDVPGVALSNVSSALTGIICALVLLVPLRDSHRETDLIDINFIGWATILLSISVLIMAITDGLIGGLVLHGVLKFKVLGLHDGIPVLTIALICAGLWIVMLGRWARDLQDVLFIAISVFAGLILSLLPWVIIIKFFDGLPMSSRILLCIVSSMASGIVVNLGLGNATDRERTYSTEGLTYCRILSLRFIRISLSSCDSKLLPTICSLLGTVFQFTIPTLLIALTAYSYLMGLDQWYTNSAGLVTESLHRTMALPIEEIKQRGMGIWYDHGFGYAMSLFGGPGKLNASGVALLLSVIGFLCTGIIVVVCRSFKLDDSKRINLIIKVPFLAELSKELDCNLVSESNKQVYRDSIRKGFLKKNAFVKGVEGIPMLAATCNAIVIEDTLSAEHRDAGLEWICKCGNRDGGFGYAPGQESDLLHTLSCINALQQTGMLEKADALKHLTWLRGELRETMNQGLAQSPTNGLSKLYYAVKGISVTNTELSISQMDKQELKTISVKLWENSLRDEKNTFHVTEILNELGEKSTMLPKEIMESIDGFEAKLFHMDPNHELVNIYRVIRMVRVAHPEDYKNRHAISTTKDNLAKTYGASKLRALIDMAQNYLKKIEEKR